MLDQARSSSTTREVKMKSYGFKIIEAHEQPECTIYKIVAAKDAIVNFGMNKDQVSLGTFYDGRMVITNAANKDLIGMVLEGWMSKPELDTERSWYTCHVEKEMKDWLCVHSTKYTKCEYVEGDIKDIHATSYIYVISPGRAFVLS